MIYSTTFDLIDVLKPLTPIRLKNKFLAQIFQAIRIEVNNELGGFKIIVKTIFQSTKTRGAFGLYIISFIRRSLCKTFFSKWKFR